jgi:hypothetical protein
VIDRDRLAHAIRAAAELSGERELVVIGAAAILGAVETWPAQLPRSREVDVFGTSANWDSEALDALLGQASQFHRTHGFYVDAVSTVTAAMPPDWRDRARRISMDVYGRQVRVLIIHPLDLALAKYVAWREKDRLFTAGLAKLGLTKKEALLPLAARMQPALDDIVRRDAGGQLTVADLVARIEADFGG